MIQQQKGQCDHQLQLTQTRSRTTQSVRYCVAPEPQVRLAQRARCARLRRKITIIDHTNRATLLPRLGLKKRKKLGRTVNPRVYVSPWKRTTQDVQIGAPYSSTASSMGRITRQQ